MSSRDQSISVVVPAYNVVEYVEEALESVAAQTLQPLEVIVVDDGSTDGTAAAIERLRRQRRDLWPPLTVVRQVNAGQSAARNAALRRARGTYVAFLDADDRWHPPKLERHLSVLVARSEVDLTCSWYREIDVCGRATGRLGRPEARCVQDLLRASSSPLLPSAVVARRDALKRAGGFDPTLRSYEDRDLWLRMASLRPRNLEHLREVLVDHRRRPGQISAAWSGKIADWERVIDKARLSRPALVTAVEWEARARQRLWVADLAYRAGDRRAALRKLLSAWAVHPLAAARRRISWKLIAALMLGPLPRAPADLLRAVRSCRGPGRRSELCRDRPAR